MADSGTSDPHSEPPRDQVSGLAASPGEPLLHKPFSGEELEHAIDRAVFH